MQELDLGMLLHSPEKRGRDGDVQILGLEPIVISGKLACYLLRTTVPGRASRRVGTS